MSAAPQILDVAILGGGLAGSLLARQLRRQMPSLRLALLEREIARSPKVGEALVEISANHLLRRHGLSSYLYEHQLPKNGLRYFFDTPECDAALAEMSEIGSHGLPFHPAFQLDRARLEEDLLAMNRSAGIDVREGTRVDEVVLADDGAPHRLRVRDATGESELGARWVIDASGRVGFLARQLGLRRQESDHAIGSTWGRFENVADIDLEGPESFRSRVRHTARRLSTLHFWYSGYWMWMIPLRGGLTSVGLSGALVRERKGLRTADGFVAFLREHRAIADLLREAKLVDHAAYSRIAYGTERFFSPQRFALCGEAATAADPLYSPGGDFIALENDYICDLVARDLAGDPTFAERLELYEGFMHFRHEATMCLYRGQYGTSGSFDLARIKWDFDLGCYYNLWVDAYLRDQHLDPRYLREQLRLQGFVLNALRSFSALFQRVEAHLHAKGTYYRANKGETLYGLGSLSFAEEIGTDRSRRRSLEVLCEIMNAVRDDCLRLLDETPAVEKLPLMSFLSGRAFG